MYVKYGYPLPNNYR